MLKHRDLTEERIRLASRRIFACIYTHSIPLKARYFPSQEPLSWQEIKGKRFKPVKVGEQWGDDFSCAWFQLTGQVNQQMKGHQVVALIDIDGEACLYDKKGTPIQGLTPKYPDEHNGLIGPKKEVKLLSSARGNEKIDLLLDAGANHLWTSANPSRVKQIELAVFNPMAWKLYHEYRFLEQLMKELPHERHRQLIMAALNEVCNVLGDCQPRNIRAARGILKSELMRPARHSALNVSAIGHAHIDVAWLWPLRETVRKTARTFSTALQLMDEYPDYKFGASQPHLYQMMKDHHPGLYRKISLAVKKGKWEVQGGMWVESDTNIPSGESLIRQVLFGKRFYQDEFGIDVRNLWLPDVFGYSAALPQILKKSGIDYFTTHKLNWNQFNKFPHHTMLWKGLDGTPIFAHFMAGNDYNAPCTPASFMNYERENKDNQRSDHALCLFGIGDGGGGPGRTHLEWLNLASDLEDLPKVTPEFAADFFPKAQKNARDLLTWEGELYFEYHRGTYTSQALVKKQNRRMEILLREVELAWSMLPLSRYPARSLEQAWKTVLLNQFHDIIPGSSITRVYKEAHEQYRQVEQTLNELLDEADHLWMGTLCNDKRHIDNLDVGKLEKLYAVRNSLSWDRTELVMVPETSRSHGKTSKWMSAGGDPITCQRIQGGTLLQVNAPAFGHNLIGQGPTREISPAGLQVSQKVLQNRLIRVEFAADGNIRRIYDKLENREVLRAGARGNQFCLFEDQPLAYEAWDIDAFYMEVKPEHPRLVSNQILEQGPLRASLVQTWTSEKYDIRQVISLTHDSRLIGFETRVDWRESRHMLRVQFPVDIHASQANYEIQFGHVSRPTHMNTSWDMARFEVVAHKWADISQPNYGVAIINDCKYGHQILGNTISLNLLRSPKIPDAEADMHVHEFRYGLLPHPGDLHHSEVITKAHEFNTPLRVLKAEPGRVKKPVRRSLNSSSPSLIVSNQPNVIIDTVKKAESDNALIVRCFEAYGTDCTCKLEFAAPVKQVHLVNLLESQVEEIELSDNRVELTFNPFEIITLKVS